MKKNCLFLLAMLASVTLSFGKTVSVNTAKTIGFNYLSQRTSDVKSADGLTLVYTSGTAASYFYVFSGSHSFVLVAADDAVTPILGYSTEGAFITDHISRNVTGFFEDYNKQIDYAINNNVAASAEIATKWDNLLNNRNTSGAAHRTTDVAPLLGALKWDQSPDGINPSGYYNDDCPVDPMAGGGALSVTGCVATATAQVMKFWNWPAHGVGSNSYTTSSTGVSLFADFGATTYDWASMPTTLTTHNPAVARLMSDVGISVDMDYTADESGAYVVISASPITNCAEYALKSYFSYDPSLHGEQRMDYSDATWISMLKSNLDAGEPVIYTGDGTAGGHCFVFDGYETAGSMFHVNWGWSGSDDGYFTIDALNPASLGTGGGAGGFNADQTAIFGIKPGAAVSTTLELASPVTAPSAIGYTQPFSVTTSIHNSSATAFSGHYTAFVFDAGGTLIDSVQVLAGALAAGATSGTLTFNTSSPVGLVPMLAGNYTVSIYAAATAGGWALVSAGSYINSASISVSNSAPMELWDALTVTTPSSGVLMQGAPATVTTNFVNYGTVDFSGSFEMVLLDLGGTVVSTIQVMSGMTLPMSDYYSSDISFSTTNVTAAPGTYLLTAAYSVDGVTWYYAGADYYQNPVYVTVVAPPPSPDMYEVNNTAATAYNLTPDLAPWSSNTSHTSTPGSNFHVTSDQDYYKIVLPAGYHYTISARVNDLVSADDGITYTADAIWSYSTDGGTTWSTVYDDVMPGTPPATINIGGSTGGTVIFHVSSHFGATGTYLLKISNITRVSTASIPGVALETAKIFPNPASDIITVDLSGTGVKGTGVSLFDMQGKKVYAADMNGQDAITIPVNTLSAGMYFVQLNTDAGMINKKIVVSR